MKTKWVVSGSIALLAVGALLGTLPTEPSHADPMAPFTEESQQTFRRVVEDVLPAVVSVEASFGDLERGQAEGRGRRPGPREMEELLERLPEGMRDLFRERIEEGRRFGPNFVRPPSTGSGVIIDAAGVILTNNHVVENASKVTVYMQDGRRFETADIATDPKTDIAVIKLDPEDARSADLPTAPLGDSDKTQVGDWVLAMGSPFGLQGTVTAGIVSAKGRAPAELNLVYRDFIQTDAAINPGNSGGPLVNIKGEVIGINTAIRSSTGSYAGIGFAVPTSLATSVAKQLAANGEVVRGYLGIQMREASQTLLDEEGLENGIMVMDLTAKDTPAGKAGLEPRDIIVEVEGEAIETSNELQRLVGNAEIGKTLDFEIHRVKEDSKGETRTLRVTIERQPDSFGRENRFARSLNQFEELGISVVPAEGGLRVMAADPEGPAARVGVVPGTLILEAEREPVANAGDLREALGSVDLENEGLLLRIRDREGEETLVVIVE